MEISRTIKQYSKMYMATTK